MGSSFCTPPYHRSRTKSSSSSTSRIRTAEPLRISLDLVPSPTTTTATTINDLLLLSPSPRRRCKTRPSQTASPRNPRRSRRRSELEFPEEKDVGLVVDEISKQRKRRHSARSKKEKLTLVPFLPPSTPSPKAEEENGGDVEGVGQLMSDLILWRDVSKSTLWFGFGSLSFLSSCFTKGLNISIFSTISHLAILLLVVSFISNSLCQRSQVLKKGYAKLREDDILRFAKLILPALNFAISKTGELFSGEPSMTLKVAPFLLLGAEYGHLITIWRLCAIGFIVSFSVPKLYSSYSAQINQRAESLKLRLLDTWSACTHKKIVVASALITFWNLSTTKTRFFTAFILIVIIRYFRQHVVHQVEDGEAEVVENEQQHALVLAEPEEKEPQQALVVAEPVCENL